MITKTKTESLSQLIRKADDVFSKYIRKYYSISGYCYCFICSKRLRISEAQTGHFIDRDQMPTRYDQLNCHPVCRYCNCVDPDHREKYVWMMIQVYGPDVVEDLRTRSRGLSKFMPYELKELIETYKEKLKKL